MNCKKARRLLGEYLDGRLEPALTERLEAHLLECEECAAQLAALRSTLQRVQSVAPLPLPEGFVERVGAAVRQRAKEQPAQNRWQMIRWLAPAFGVLIIGMLAWFGSQPGGYRGAGPLMSDKMIKRDGEPQRSVMPMPEELKEADAEAEELGPVAQEDSREAPAGPPSASLTAPVPKPAPTRPGKPAGARSALEKVKEPGVELLKERSETAEEESIQEVAEIPGPQPTEYAPRKSSGAVGFRARGMARPVADEPSSGRAAKTREAAPEMGAFAAAAPAPRPVSVRVRAQKGTEDRPEIIFRVEADRPTGMFQLSVSSEEGTQQEWPVDLLAQRSQELPAFRPPVRAEGATMWNVSLTEELTAPEQEDKALLHGEYRLFVPSRLLSESPRITVAYDEFIQEEVLADLSEQAGLVIFAPPASIEGARFSVKEVSADSVIGLTAVSFGQRVEPDGLARNLIAGESPPAESPPAAASRSKSIPSTADTEEAHPE